VIHYFTTLLWYLYFGCVILYCYECNYLDDLCGMSVLLTTYPPKLQKIFDIVKWYCYVIFNRYTICMFRVVSLSCVFFLFCSIVILWDSNSSPANNCCTKAIVDKENGIYYFREDFGPLFFVVTYCITIIECFAGLPVFKLQCLSVIVILFFVLLYCLTKIILQWIYYRLLQVYFALVLLFT